MTLYANEQFIHMVQSINFNEQKHFRAGTQVAEITDYFAKHFGTKLA